ncbi:hypothetical protein FLL45_05465 [Aliikangiella marina]|uniref:Uncharacterized protein n=1 Tax=Aliikangiella marina TaxID=1712262 RepID=A0A545TJJ6_9GAMM|nr:hypothetical protein [Aliikangiella marina]TQV77393.1 hypothetical protein FLL45_05465 [Aliikangiella marina]
MNNNDTKLDELENIELIKWAFKRGYQLGASDAGQGVFIEFSETLNYFIKELDQSIEVQSKLKYVAN